MSKPPLLPALGFIAIAGALFFLAFVMPSRDPSSPPEAAEPARRRVMEMGSFETPELGAAAVAAGNQTVVLGADAVKQPMTTAQAGRVRAAQREFLSNPDHWIPEKAEQVCVLQERYQWWRARWAAHMLRSSQVNVSPGTGSGVQTYRRMMDAACADLTKLSPAAKKKWAAWEAKNWEGWMGQPLMEKPAPNIPPAMAADADLLSRHASAARPLLEEFEYLDDLPEQIEARWDNTPAVGKAHANDLARDVELTAAEAQLHRVREELAVIAARLSAERVRWQARGWDGYAIGDGTEKTGQ